MTEMTAGTFSAIMISWGWTIWSDNGQSCPADFDDTLRIMKEQEGLDADELFDETEMAFLAEAWEDEFSHLEEVL